MVIGSGAGAAPAAYVFAKAGLPVVVLERGKKYRSADYTTDRFDYEHAGAPWERGDDDFSGGPTVQRALGLGGSTLAYQAVSQLPADNVLAKWGLDLSEFKQDARWVRDFLSISGSSAPDHPLNANSLDFYRAAQKLNWRARIAPTAILSEAKAGRSACNRCGACVFGCKPRDKGSADVTWWPEISSLKNVQILTEARVQQIQLSDARRAGVVSYTQAGENKQLRCSAVVLAAGALESPRLLLRSAQAGAEKGLGNAHVGRNLVASRLASRIVINPKGKNGHSGVPIDILIDEFAEQGIILCQGQNLAGITGPVSLAKIYARLRGPAGLQAWMSANYEKLAVLAAFSETEDIHDHGLHGTDWNELVLPNAPSPAMHALDQQKYALLDQWAEATEAQVFDRGNAVSEITGAMLRGTCRISRDPNTGAVGSTGLLHGYDNILVCDASVLGRGLIAHPSLAIQSLSRYFANSYVNKVGAAA